MIDSRCGPIFPQEAPGASGIEGALNQLEAVNFDEVRSRAAAFLISRRRTAEQGILAVAPPVVGVLKADSSVSPPSAPQMQQEEKEKALGDLVSLSQKVQSFMSYIMGRKK